ncbi:hypothetical protein AYO40_01425, partial [Planctomycetaceae bacterium SCGC AG-212-D15]
TPGGTEKPAKPGKPDEIGKGTGPGQHPDKGDPKDAGASKEVRDLVDQLKNGTQKEREEARDKLEQIRRDAKKDKADRDAADRALAPKDDKGQGTERVDGRTGKGKGELSEETKKQVEKASREIKDLVDKMQKGDDKQRKRAQDELEKLGRDARAKVDRDAANAAAKELGDHPEDKNEPGKDDKGPKGKNGNDQGDGNGDPDKGSKDRSAKGKGSPNPGKGSGSNPGVGGIREADPKTAQPVAVPGTGEGPDAKGGDRAGDLALLKFKDKVTPEMLKDAGISPEEWKKYLATRGQSKPGARKPETLPGRGTGRTISNDGPREFKSTTDRTSPLQSGGRSLPPPELMEGYKKFSEGPKEKK